jgi:molybdenum cofactor cytidylyltransferase
MGEAWAILLSAGESSRMGQLKALLPWRGRTLLEHQVSGLREGGADRVVVVLGHRAEELIPLVESSVGATWVLNPHYLQGKTTSIKTGLSALDADAVSEILLLNVDQPRSAADIARILETHRRNGYSVTVPTHGGKGGHPIVMSITLLGELLAIDEETQGIKAVVGRRPEAVNRLPLDNPEILLDLNTPDQYREAVETFAQ